jgi:hypothetical protein
MFKKLTYLTSLVLVLSLAGKGWSYASNPSPNDGAIWKDTWVSLSWRPGDHAVSHDIYLGENYDDVKHGTGGTFQGNTSDLYFIAGFPGYPYSDGLVPGTTYYWRIDEVNDLHPNSPWKGDVWSFMLPPRTAYAPAPADGAEFVEPDVTLSWQPGFRVAWHIVYFGDTFAEVNSASEGRPQGTATYTPGHLESGKTYYWRVDEFDITTTHKGDVWSFTVGAGVPPDVVGGTIYVDAVYGDDNNDGSTLQAAFATVQKGIDTTEDGDIVLVSRGVYQEEVNFLGKAITVKSTAEPAVLESPGGLAVSFYYGEGRDSILKNFIIRNSFIAVFIARSSPTISNVTVVENRYGIDAYAGAEPDISNVILWNNAGGDLFGCQARYSCIEQVTVGEGNIDADPLFVDPVAGDYRLASERGRYWPEHDVWVLDKVTSPCVDGGDPDADPSGEPTPNGNRINMGAHGGTPQASLSLRCKPLPGRASDPYPADGAVSVSTDVILSWTAGSNAVSHDVYFGTDDSLVFVGNQTTTQYDPGPLNKYTTYFWRVDEVNSEGKTTGDLWTFRTPSPKGRLCFPGETGVWIDGALVPISSVGLGQNIGRIDGTSVGGLSVPVPYLGKVEKVQEHEGTFVCYDVLLESGNCISVAENHYFLAESGRWVSLQNLRAGTKLQTAKGSIGITSVTRRPMPYVGRVYNLKVEASDRYLIGADAVIVRDY